MCGVNAFEEARRVFAAGEAEAMAVRAGGEWDGEKGRIKIAYFGAPVEVSHPEGEMFSPRLDLTRNDRVLILQYLSQATPVVPRNEWISFLQLPGGELHHVPFVNEAIKPLAEKFGSCPQELVLRARELGGTPVTMGDAGAVIAVFPRLPVAVSVREGDEEFPASANILFDATAPFHLTTAALWVLGVEVSRKLRGVTGQQFA